jgi:hypothetical protein
VVCIFSVLDAWIKIQPEPSNALCARSDEEIEAVFAHELGRAHLFHIRKLLIFAKVISFVCFLVELAVLRLSDRCKTRALL